MREPQSQPVIYVTERCVFQLTPAASSSSRWRPASISTRDILAHMDFKPIIHKPVPMDPRIFLDEPMELLSGSAEPQAL